jgi:hypothetical protein
LPDDRRKISPRDSRPARKTSVDQRSLLTKTSTASSGDSDITSA